MRGKSIVADIEAVISIVEYALAQERASANFYKEYASLSNNPQGKEMFLKLMDFEKYHVKKLEELLKSLKTEGKFIEYEPFDDQPIREILSSDIPLPPNVGLDMANASEIIGFAVSAEALAWKFYLEKARTFSDPKGKNMFLKMAREENLHKELLSEELRIKY